MLHERTPFTQLSILSTVVIIEPVFIQNPNHLDIFSSSKLRFSNVKKKIHLNLAQKMLAHLKRRKKQTFYYFQHYTYVPKLTFVSLFSRFCLTFSSGRRCWKMSKREICLPYTHLTYLSIPAKAQHDLENDILKYKVLIVV